MKDDEKDAAQIRQSDAVTANTFFMAGYDPDAIIQYLATDDISVLMGTHNGMLPVQQHPDSTGGTQSEPSANGAQNGNPIPIAQSGAK